MAKDILRRTEAPVTDEAWQLIDEEAQRVLRGNLSARALVDFDGPYGWQKDVVNIGTLDLSKGKKTQGVSWGTRKVMPLVEARVGFELEQMELDSISRGSKAPDLDAVAEAARKIAIFEESAIYTGLKEAGMEGLLGSSAHKAVSLGKSADAFDSSIASAVETLQLAGVNGPYNLVLGTKPYHQMMRGRLQGAYTLQQAIKDKTRGDIVWSPAIEGGVLVSARGGDFELTVGQDLSIGYCRHDSDKVEFYIAESFAFRVIEPKAIVVLNAAK